MGKDIKTRAAQEVKTLESVGEPGKRMKQAYIREKQRITGEASGTSPPPLGEERVPNQAGAVHSEQPEYVPSAKGKTLKIPSPGERMKVAFLQAKKAAVSEQPIKQDQQEDPSAQAAQQAGETGKRVGDSAFCRVERAGRESISQVKPRVEQARESFRELKSAVGNVREESQSFVRKRLPPAVWKREGTAIKTSAKGNVKTATRSIKTAERSSSAAIKTS